MVRAGARGKPPSRKKQEDVDPELLEDEYALPSSKQELAKSKGNKKFVSIDSDDDDDDEEEDGLDEEAVYDLSDEDGDSDGDDEDDEDEDDEDDLEALVQKGGKLGRIAKQAKLLDQQLKLRRGADGSDEEEEEEEEGEGEGEEGGRLWGANKRAYYDADTADFEIMDDREVLKEEEDEVLRLQREKAAKLRASDYGLDDDDDDDDDDDEEDGEEEEDEEEGTMGAAARRASGSASARTSAKKSSSKSAAAASAAVQVEAIARDLTGLSDEQRLAAVMADAPELLALVQELRDCLAEVRHRVGPLLKEVREGKLGTADGVSYLEAKHLLLLQYASHIVFYLLLKAEGRPVRSHPVIARLVEIRAYLEKIRPIDKQLSYQMEKLLRAAQMAADAPAGGGGGAAAANGGGGGAAADEDELRYRPQPGQLVPKVDAAAAEANGGGVYRPPKLNPMAMEGEGEDDLGAGGLSGRDARRLKEARRRGQRSAIVKELAEELAGAPEELRAEAEPGLDSAAALKMRQRLEARARAEEDLMTRVPMSKDEAKRLKAQRRAGLSGNGLLDDFGDEVDDLVDLARGLEGGGKGGSKLSELFARQKVSQKFGGEVAAKAARGGDDDLPRRESLSERRNKFDAAAARRAAAAGGGGSDDDDDGMDYDGYEEHDLGGGGGRKKAGGKRLRGEEDEFYAAVKGANFAKRQAKSAAAAAAGALHPPLPDARATEGARKISYEIEANRGLTPHRRKDLKNPRKKHRVKYEKALVRRKGQVASVRSGEGKYGGEASGINPRVAKGRRLG